MQKENKLFEKIGR